MDSGRCLGLWLAKTLQGPETRSSNNVTSPCVRAGYHFGEPHGQLPLMREVKDGNYIDRSLVVFLLGGGGWDTLVGAGTSARWSSITTPGFLVHPIVKKPTASAAYLKQGANELEVKRQRVLFIWMIEQDLPREGHVQDRSAVSRPD